MTKSPKRLTWKTEKRRVSDLIPLKNNPRIMTEKQVADLRKSVEKFNLVEIPVIDTDNNIIAGHQRLKIMEMIGRAGEEIEVRVPSRKLTPDEVREYNIRSNRNVGSWDFEMLANSFDQAELIEWGFEPYEFGTEDANLSDDKTYTSKIVAPVYEPKGERPPVTKLIDRAKTQQLITEIDNAELPDEIAVFLRLAAERHTVFNFRQIAEFYCHSDTKVQDLMERSGLIIIDFKKAIEYGFVNLTDRLSSLAELDGDDGNGDA